MDFSLSDEQISLVNDVAEYCAEYFGENDVRTMYEKHEIPLEATKAWVDRGHGLLGLDEAYGGKPASKLTIGLALEAAYHHSAATLPFINSTMALFYLSNSGTPEQIETLMSQYRQTGRTPFSLGISEPEAGSDTMNMTTCAQRQEDGAYLINGKKTFLAQGSVSPYILVLAKDEDPSRANSSISMWLVPRDTEGVRLEPMGKIGQQIIPVEDCTLTDVRVIDADRLGEEGAGFLGLMKGLETERCFVACWSLGLAQAAMDDAASYVSERIVFEKPLSSFQLIQEKLTEMETKLQASRVWLYRTLWELDNGISVRTSSALMKRFVVRSAFEIADDALQIMGGIGYAGQSRVGRIWADCRGNRFGAGTDEIMVHIAGRQIAKQYRRN